MTLWSTLADLEIAVDGYRLEALEEPTPRFTRTTTVVVLAGGGCEGRGEDVSYSPEDNAAHRRLVDLPVRGRRTLAAWSELLDGLDLVPVPTAQHAATDYRRWAWESALVDLGLRQAGTDLAAVLGRERRPVRFCLSSGLPVSDWLAAYPDAEFKRDADAAWTDDDVRALAATGRVRVIDLKALYGDDAPDFALPDPAGLTARVLALAPDAVVEDPPLDEASRAVLAGHLERVAFDAPVHRLADVERLPATGFMNIKPSRFGTWRELLATVDALDARGVRLYGGGQYELGPGRPQIQELASLLYPDGPNDVAPGAYNRPAVVPGLPTSPLPPPAAFGA